VGPFGDANNFQEHVQMPKNAMDRVAVPQAWTQVVLFNSGI